MVPRVIAECSAQNETSLHHPSTKGQLTLKKAIETIQETEDGEEYCEMSSGHGKATAL